MSDETRNVEAAEQAVSEQNRIRLEKLGKLIEEGRAVSIGSGKGRRYRLVEGK